MRWLEQVAPVAMARVAVVMPQDRIRQVLAVVAAAGTVELEVASEPVASEVVEAMRRVEQARPDLKDGVPRLSSEAPDPQRWEREGRWDLLAGEAELERRAAVALDHRSMAVAVGWMPQEALHALGPDLESCGAALVELPRPAWQLPPTMLPHPPGSRQFHPLVETYGTARYEDVDPTPFAAASFVLMFGMMFGDAGDGLILAALAVATRLIPSRRLRAVRKVWHLILAMGLSATLFGLAYGEAFGPTGLVSPLWLQPLADPIRLLVAGVAVGGCLLAISYSIGAVNRVREAGFGSAIVAASGLAGLVMFAGAALAAAGWLASSRIALIGGGAALIGGTVLVFVGLLLHAGFSPSGVIQAVIETFDSIIRLGANTVSFARLAAFGMVHAAIGAIVWSGTVALWDGGLRSGLAILLFAVGTTLAFALEALVAGVQALRLEYYELFSKIFAGEGRPFRPWHIELARAEESS